VSGICLYRCYQLAPEYMASWATAITCLAVAFIAITLFFPPAPVLDAFGFAALVFGLAYQRGPVNEILQSRVSLYLGKISFSFYLSHFLIISIISWAIGPWLTAQGGGFKIVSLMAVIFLCLSVATVLYRWVERPSQRFGHYLIKSRQTTVPATPNESMVSSGA
jgi:peptidoglycan/LPS O-acetylase OafA/YrhL